MGKLLEVTDPNGKTLGWLIHCPACGHSHEFNVAPGDNGVGGRKPCWTFNGDMERPTFTPSLKVTCSSWQNIRQAEWMPVSRNNCHDPPCVRVPFAMLSEKHAQRCHSQTLSRLRERGGLSAHEALCHLDRIGLWDREPTDTDHEEVGRRVDAWLKDACPPEVCHSYVRDGRIEYLGDCTHAMAGQTVELPDA